jgi:hypothetical protein
MDNIELTGVTEYGEEMPVVLCRTSGMFLSNKGKGRLVIKAMNEGGCNCTEVDLIELIQWLKINKPELLL